MTQRGFVRLAAGLWGLSAGLWGASAHAVTFTVNNGGDSSDGACNAAHCTLREAITAVSGMCASGPHTIAFNLPTSDPGYSAARRVAVIRLTSDLPGIECAGTVVDGATQPDTNPTTFGAVAQVGRAGMRSIAPFAVPDVEIDGGGATNWIFLLRANGVRVRNLGMYGVRTAGGVGIVANVTTARTGVTVENVVWNTRSDALTVTPPGRPSLFTNLNDGFTLRHSYLAASNPGPIVRNTAVMVNGDGNTIEDNVFAGLPGAINVFGGQRNTIRGNDIRQVLPEGSPDYAVVFLDNGANNNSVVSNNLSTTGAGMALGGAITFETSIDGGTATDNAINLGGRRWACVDVRNEGTPVSRHVAARRNDCLSSTGVTMFNIPGSSGGMTLCGYDARGANEALAIPRMLGLRLGSPTVVSGLACESSSVDVYRRTPSMTAGARDYVWVGTAPSDAMGAFTFRDTGGGLPMGSTAMVTVVDGRGNTSNAGEIAVAGCASAAECNDSNPCTTDACTAGACASTPVAAGMACPTGVCNGVAAAPACVQCVSNAQCATNQRCDTATNRCVAAMLDAGPEAGADAAVDAPRDLGPDTVDAAPDAGRDATPEAATMDVATTPDVPPPPDAVTPPPDATPPQDLPPVQDVAPPQDLPPAPDAMVTSDAAPADAAVPADGGPNPPSDGGPNPPNDGGPNTPNDSGPNTGTDTGGCGCRVGETRPIDSRAGLVALAAFAMIARRRRSRAVGA